MIREEHFQMMKKGSYLINNSRGTVVSLKTYLVIFLI